MPAGLTLEAHLALEAAWENHCLLFMEIVPMDNVRENNEVLEFQSSQRAVAFDPNTPNKPRTRLELRPCSLAECLQGTPRRSRLQGTRTGGGKSFHETDCGIALIVVGAIAVLGALGLAVTCLLLGRTSPTADEPGAIAGGASTNAAPPDDAAPGGAAAGAGKRPLVEPAPGVAAAGAGKRGQTGGGIAATQPRQQGATQPRQQDATTTQPRQEIGSPPADSDTDPPRRDAILLDSSNRDTTIVTMSTLVLNAPQQAKYGAV